MSCWWVPDSQMVPPSRKRMWSACSTELRRWVMRSTERECRSGLSYRSCSTWNEGTQSAQGGLCSRAHRPRQAAATWALLTKAFHLLRAVHVQEQRRNKSQSPMVKPVREELRVFTGLSPSGLGIFMLCLKEVQLSGKYMRIRVRWT